ncbi:MAG: hypothetical protein R3B82_22325 [Sandaracinaceae bacterium]
MLSIVARRWARCAAAEDRGLGPVVGRGVPEGVHEDERALPPRDPQRLLPISTVVVLEVEEVVLDLEGDPEGDGEAGERLDLRFTRAKGARPRPGWALMNVYQQVFW